jgi:exosome complex component CSL4
VTVFPGDFVGAAEEYVPGFGIYEEKGKLYASNTGELQLDAKTHSARVISKTRIPKLQGVGIITLGVVASVSENVALIDLAPMRSKSFEFVPCGISAVLHVSDVKQRFVEALSDEVKTGDIVRVKIIEVSPHTIRLTTSEKDLGVVKAFCSRCRHGLKRLEYRLTCPRCGSIETRKIAFDYRG